jgi:hypothetical protein
MERTSPAFLISTEDGTKLHPLDRSWCRAHGTLHMVVEEKIPVFLLVK